MAKQYKVLVNTGKADNNKAFDVQQFSGDKGQPVRIKAQAGAKYQMQELGRGKPVGPDYVKAKRVGKDLHILFQDESQASLIIEDYYSEMAQGYNGVIGQAENGSFYEYIPEDPRVPGLIPQLAEGGQAVNVALGGVEVTPAGAALAVAAFPLMGLLGLGAAGAAAAYYINKDDKAANGITGKLSDTSDLADGGQKDDSRTRDNTPTLTGTVPAGSQAHVTINGVRHPVNVDSNGNWTFQQPTALPDGTYYPVLHVEQNGVTTNHNLTPFTVDTVAPAVAITNSAAALAPGETSTVTFTLSEPSADFNQGDVQVEGGTLSNFQQDPINPLKYTATFTPSSSGTSASIHVASDKFQDAAGNRNTDGAEADNTYTFKTNASTTGGLKPTAPNDSGTLGDNITKDNTPELVGKVPAGTTAAKVLINGVEYPVTVNPDGTWSFTQPTALPDGTYNPQLIVTDGSGKQSTTPITPFTIDTVPPTVFVQTNASTLVSGQTAAVTFTLSEPVADFKAEDVTVTGGTLSNFAQSPTDPKVYTATFTPASTGSSATIGVDSNKFSDAAANFNTDGAERGQSNTNQVSLVTNASASGGLSSASDNSTGTPGDNKTNDPTPELNGRVPAGSKAEIELNGQKYPVNVNPDGSWSFTQPAGLPDGYYEPKLIVTPANGGTPSTTPITPFTIDTTPPTIAVARSGSGTVGSAGEVISFTLSEASTDFTVADISVTGGSLGPLVQSATNPLVYTATFTPTAGATGTATIGVSAGRFADAAGNQNLDTWADNADSVANHLVQANNQVSLSYDTRGSNTVAPSNKTALYIDPVSANTDNILSLSEGTATTSTINGFVSGTFAAGDLISLVLNGNTYTALADANGNFTATVAVADLKADADKTIEANVTGTGGSYATAAQTYQVETAANSGKTTALSIDPVTADNIIGKAESTSANVPVNGYVSGAFSTNDTVTLTINGKTFTGKPDSTGFFSINVPGSDLAADPDTKVEGTVTGTGGTTAKAVQDYGIDASSDPRNLDPAGDTTPPTIVVARTNPGAAQLDASSKETIVFTLSEPSTSFDGSDIVVSGGTLSGLTPVASSGSAASGYTQYTAVFTPTAGSAGTATIGVASGRFADTAGNLNQDTYLSPAPSGASYESNNLVSLAFDTRSTNPVDNDKPTILVSIDKTTLASGQTATLTFILSEASADFTLADITVFGGNGSVTNLLPVAGSNGAQYTATYTAGTSAGTDRIGVDAARFSDAAGNLNADTYKGSATGTSAVTGTMAEANNWVSLTNTGAADTTAPTIVVTRGGSGTVGATGETVYFTLSEASSNFAQSDVDVTGGQLSSWTQLNATQYSATFTPAANASGIATVGVSAGKFSDKAANLNQDDYNLPGAENANNMVTLAFNTLPADTIAPTIALSRSGSGNLAAGGSEVINIVLSEASTNFDIADIVVTGGTLSGFAPVAGSGSSASGYTDYVVTFTPVANSAGTGTIAVASLKFTDAAGNNNRDTYTNPAPSGDTYEANNLVSIAYNTTVADTTAPTVVVTRSGQGLLSAPETVYFTLSEASTDFAQSDVTVTGGTLSNFVPVSSSGNGISGYTQYQATFTPTANSSGMATIGVLAGVFQDAAGNQNQDTYLSPAPTGQTYELNNIVSLNYNTRALDVTAPTISVGRLGTGLVTSAETITFTLSEPSTDFVLGDIDVTGGQLANLLPVSSSGTPATGYTQYTATFTPTAGTLGTATIGVLSDKFSDSAGNYNKDTYATGVAGTTQEVNNSISLNFNSVAPDTTPPTITVERLGSGTLTSSETIRFTISEATKDFTLADISVTGGQLSNLAAVPTSGTVGTGFTTYVATFTPTAGSSGLATIGVAAGKFSDAAANFNLDTFSASADSVAGHIVEANNKVDISYNTQGNPTPDTTTPTIVVERAGTGTLASGNTDTITFTLSEASLTFDVSDVTVTGGSLSNWTMVADSGTPSTGYTVYTATFTPTASGTGTATIGVLSDKFTDAAGNNNKDTYATGVSGTTFEANNQVSIGYNTVAPDTTSPTVEVLRSASGTMTGAETIYFNFSEATTDFALADISVSGGAMSNLLAVAGSGNKQYTAIFTPNAGATGTATIGVLASKFSDAAGNLNKDTFDPADPAAGKVVEINNLVSASYNTTANPADITPPTVAIGRVGSGAVTSSETLVFTFSEPVTGFTLADVVDTSSGNPAANLSNLQAVTGSNNTQFTATWSAPSNSVGSLTLGIKAGTFTDTATAPNANKDTYQANLVNTVQEANNQLTLAWDTDTTPPTIAISSSASNLGLGGTATITFALSEASSDFAQSMVDVVGGQLSNWTQVNATTYTATFTPNAGSQGTATIGVLGNKFRDLGALGNLNLDTYAAGANYEANNQTSITFDTRTTTFAALNDTATATEAGGTNNATAGADISKTAAQGLLANDSGTGLTVSAIAQGSNTGSVGTALAGQYGTLTVQADGSYTYAVSNNNATVQALKGSSNTLTEVFTYTTSGTANGSAQNATANLVITITGANDAPVAVADTATAVEAGGASNASAGTNPTGNVLTNDTDVDLADTKTVSAITGGTVGTAKVGTYGSLTLNADGSYSYVVDNTNTAVQALRTSSQTLTDTFTYTVADAAGATSTATLTVTVQGANDAPTTVGTLANQTGTAGTAITPYQFAATGIFADVDSTANGETATYSAKLANGQALSTIGLSFDPATRTFSGTPTAAGTYTIVVTDTDAGGLTTTATFDLVVGSGSVTPSSDTVPPTLAITDGQAAYANNTENVVFTFTFSEPVTGFDATDVTVTNGTKQAGTFTPIGTATIVNGVAYYSTYQMTVTTPASGSGTTSVTVAAGSYTDVAGNAGNLASATQAYLPGGSGSGGYSSGPKIAEAGTAYGSEAVELTNGNIATLAPGNLSGSSWSSTYLRDGNSATGAELSETNLVGQFSGDASAAIFAMQNGQYGVIAARSSTPSDRALTVFNADGTISAVSNVTVATGAADRDVSAVQLSNGNIALSYLAVSGSNYDVYVKVVSPTGTAISTTAGLGAIPVSGRAALEMVKLSNNNVVAIWTSDTEIKTQVLTSTGVQQGSPSTTTISALVTTTGPWPDQTFSGFEPHAIALQGGGFALTWTTGDQVRRTNLAIFNSSGQRVGTSIALANPTNYSDHSGSDLVQLNDGRIMVAWTEMIENNGQHHFVPHYRIVNLDGSFASDDVTLNNLYSLKADTEGGTVTALTSTAASSSDMLALAKMADGRVMLLHSNKATILSSFDGPQTLSGDANANTLSGGDGADTLTGGGGADVILAGAGNDTVVLNASNITQLGTSGSTTLVDGGTGVNTLRFDTSAAATLVLDLTNVDVGNRLSNFQKFDITGNGNNTLKLNVSDVLQSTMTAAAAGVSGSPTATKVVQIDGNAGDVVELSKLLDGGSQPGTWSTSSTTTIGATTYNVYNYSADPSLQVLIDNHIASVTLS